MSDLRFRNEVATPHEVAAIDAALPADARGRRDLLLPALHAANDLMGWVSPGALNHICRSLNVAPADAYAVATFYDLLSVDELPPVVAMRCVDLACRIVAVPAVAPEGMHVIESPCLGLCERAPAIAIRSAGEVPSLMLVAEPEVPVQIRGPLSARIGVLDPASLDAYRTSGGFETLATARVNGPAWISDQVDTAGLMGRGGAAFPTARKWRAVLGQTVSQHYVVANADESEPGTFKDRIVMEGDPFSVIEAVALACLAAGADHAFIYLRGEYAVANERLQNAIDSSTSAGLLGELRIEIRRGAGAYICGEETAIFNSIEGFRGEPRSKPPFPVEVGLFGKPTAVNNIETLVAALAICRGDGVSTKLFCLSGHVARPGMYEVPVGTTLGEIITMSGAEHSDVQAVLMGGSAGAFATPAEFATPLTAEGMRSINATLGSGVVMVLDHSVNMADFAGRIAEFFQHESCGQCVPCRVGTVRQVELLSVGDRALLKEVDQVMTDSSICGLGQTAASAIRSAIAKGLL